MTSQPHHYRVSQNPFGVNLPWDWGQSLTGTTGTIPFFDAIGWGQWFRYASGALDAAGALLIFMPRWTSYGALIIPCTVGLGTILCFTMALQNPIFPLVLTLLAGMLTWLAWRPKPA